jgi:hypothetical protein
MEVEVHYNKTKVPLPSSHHPAYRYYLQEAHNLQHKNTYIHLQ